MRLNIECIRDVLLYLEDNLEIIDFIESSKIVIPNYETEDIDYSLIKLIEANYLKGKFSTYLSGDYVVYINEITWSGHQFLDNIRDNTVWTKTKEKLSPFSSVSISIVSQVAANVLTKLITS